MRLCSQQPKAFFMSSNTAMCHTRALRKRSAKMCVPKIAFSRLRRGMHPWSYSAGAACGTAL
eukprot:3226391-Pyramimonas_sp.AAC.1